eukprot:GHVL01016949.1.p3 GENE.GHVL01016949.1~~GHVL01016949.1.p3  ORF type:complete len:108 (+),score=17.20 GHVL01016949.1:1258-1581(+)
MKGSKSNGLLLKRADASDVLHRSQTNAQYPIPLKEEEEEEGEVPEQEQVSSRPNKDLSGIFKTIRRPRYTIDIPNQFFTENLTVPRRLGDRKIDEVIREASIKAPNK